MATPRTSRYTVYAPTMTDAHTFLNKIFRSKDPKVRPLIQDLVGKEGDAFSAVVKTANAVVQNGVGGLLPADGMQAGDPGMFPNGVDLSFGYSTGPTNGGPPDIKGVKWTKAGDPAFGYAPDITSPGPGLTEGTDKSTDPDIKPADIKPNYPALGSTENTKSPLVTADAIYAENILTVIPDKGKSGG